MITALAYGAEAIRPVRTIEEAWEVKKKWPDALMGGERHGERIEGFDLGNSPLEYRENVRGREIITTTTNGTIALRAVERAATVLAGAILNMGALADYLTAQPPPAILLVCAGTFREAALEDILAAGMLISLLPGVELSDAGQAALALYRQEARDLTGALRRASNGRVLLGKGREPEIEWCATASMFPLVARMDCDGVVTAER